MHFQSSYRNICIQNVATNIAQTVIAIIWLRKFRMWMPPCSHRLLVQPKIVTKFSTVTSSQQWSLMKMFGKSTGVCWLTVSCRWIAFDYQNTMKISIHVIRISKNNHWLMRWCPAPNCDLAIRAPYLLSYQQNCVCDCGQRFCFSCGDESHDPLPCNLISKWKQGGYDETLFYLTVNTKSCPRCTVIIEKDGGGNCVVGSCSLFCSSYIFDFNRWHRHIIPFLEM